MIEKEHTVPAAGGFFLPVRHWDQNAEPAGAVLILHGMAEHSGRYADFAGSLVRAGFAVYAPDLRGHGKAIRLGVRGSFGPRGGWKLALEDVRLLTAWIAGRHPGRPIFLFGHSLGALIGQAALERCGTLFSGAVLSGAFLDKPVRRPLSPLIASVMGLGKMEKPCQALFDITFREYNRSFDGRTPFDWLSGIPEVVDKYAADPLCGFVCTASLYRDAGTMLVDSLRKSRIAAVPNSLPILFIVGEHDAMGGPAVVARLARRWEAQGKNATVKIYRGARHESFNDISREACMADIITFFRKTAIQT